jgi:hypothetical protein
MEEAAMVRIRVIKYLDSEEREALLEIACGENTLWAYACPFAGTDTRKEVTLYAMEAFRVAKCDTWYRPSRIPNTAFGYHLCAEVVDARRRLVRIGEINIILDTSIDSDIPAGALIHFDTIRLDY